MTRLEELFIKLTYGPGLTEEEYKEYYKDQDLITNPPPTQNKQIVTIN